MRLSLSDQQLNSLKQRPQVGDAIFYSLEQLLMQDRHLLEVNANERSICFRFAMYLQSQLPNWNVDCEYNRDGVDAKKIGYLEMVADTDDVEARTVFPDIIVHLRGGKENLLVLEFKKSSNTVSRKIDLKKLQGYRNELNYPFALFVEVGVYEKAGTFELQWI